MLVHLSGELCVHRARELHQEIGMHVREAAATRKALDVDLSEVIEIDSAGIQVLLHAKRELERQGIQMHLLRHAEAVVQSFDLLGLSRHFGDPMVVGRSA